jgi:peptidoglycan hydrolase CwlO-like protein
MWEKKYRVFLDVSEVDGMQSNTEDEVLENEVKELSPLIELLNY